MFHSHSTRTWTFRRTLIGLAAFAFFLAVAPAAFGQPTPRATDRVNETKPSQPRPGRTRPRPQPNPVAATPASVDSQLFVDLGDSFRDKEKWNAAEAAYKEASKVWANNGDALLALGYLYLDEKNSDLKEKLENARAVHSKLRQVDSSLASILLTEINKFQAQVNH